MAAGATQLERIVSRFVEQSNGCWHHPSNPGSKGYAVTKFGWPISKSVLIHRLSWEYFNGPIPKDMVLDHLCHNPVTCTGGNPCEHRRCVNPNHLQLVTESENNKKTVRVLKYRTHCKNGHKLENNIYTYNRKGVRSNGCATCMKRLVKVGV